MRIILIGTDRKLFDTQSVVRERIARFGSIYTEGIDSIVFSTRAHGIRREQELAPHVHAYPTNSVSRFLYGVDARRIARKLQKPDIVSAQDPFETGLVALLIARYFRIPYAVEVHTDFLAAAFVRHSFLNRVRVLFAGYVLRRAAGGYVVSKRIRDAMISKYRLTQNFEVLPIYVDIRRFQALPRTPKKGNILWIGRFTEEKNPTRAIQALATARAAAHDVRLTLLGSGPLEHSLRAQAHELGMDDFVTFAGWQDPAEYLPETELVLATSEYEGYGMSIVEALAAGVPVLSTDVGVAREAGAWIAEGDFSAAFCDMLTDAQAAAKLQLPTYASEDDYLSQVAACYTALL